MRGLRFKGCPYRAKRDYLQYSTFNQRQAFLAEQLREKKRAKRKALGSPLGSGEKVNGLAMYKSG